MIDIHELARAITHDPAALAELIEALRPHWLDRHGEELLTTAEAATFLRTDAARVRRLVHERRLPALHDGTRVLIRRRDLERHVGGAS